MRGGITIWGSSSRQADGRLCYYSRVRAPPRDRPDWTRSSAELFATRVPLDAVEGVLRLAEENGLLVQYYVGDTVG